MNTHLQSVHNVSVSNSNLRRSTGSTSAVLSASKTKLTTAQEKWVFARRTALWLCEDLLPFSLVQGSGFKRWMMNNGFVNEESQIPSNVAISQAALSDCYNIVLNAFKDKMSKAPKTITLVSDMWTSLGKQAYITISVRYLDNDLKLINTVMSTEMLDHPHTGEAIAKAIFENLAYFGLEDKIITAVGDNGKNIIRIGPQYLPDKTIPALLPNCKQYCRCLGHRIHLVLSSDAIKDKNFEAAVKLIGKMKKIHGVLAYRMNEIKEEYYKQQMKEMMDTLNDLEHINNELLQDEQNGEIGDEEFADCVRAVYEQCIGGHERHTRFEQMNVTRWKSAENLTTSFVKNFGNYL